MIKFGMNPIPLLITAAALATAVTSAAAENFAGKKFDFSSPVVPGTLLQCESMDAGLLQRSSPKAFAWAVAQGLAEQSAVSGTASFTAKVTTKNSSGHPEWFFGCWVATEIVKETVSGQEKAYAKGTFKVNDALRDSPMAEWALCKKKKTGAYVYTQGDYRVVNETDPLGCTANQWQARLAPLAAAESETVLFSLRPSSDKKGYVRNVGW